MSLLPIEVPINYGKVFKICSWAHFLNVTDSQAESIPGGSSWNLQEALVTESLVRSLLGLPNTSAANILVLTGYRRQLKLLQELAKKNAWGAVEIKTIDGSQGAEQEIVILSTVRTFGGVGFMASKNRANVCTSRAREALFFVVKWQFSVPEQSSFSFLRAVLQNMKQHISGFVVDTSLAKQK